MADNYEVVRDEKDARLIRLTFSAGHSGGISEVYANLSPKGVVLSRLATDQKPRQFGLTFEQMKRLVEAWPAFLEDQRLREFQSKAEYLDGMGKVQDRAEKLGATLLVESIEKDDDWGWYGLFSLAWPEQGSLGEFRGRWNRNEGLSLASVEERLDIAESFLEDVVNERQF